MGRRTNFPAEEIGRISATTTAIGFNPQLFVPIETAPIVRSVLVRDNLPFIERVNASALLDALPKPTKNVVVSQSPAPGEQVPAGTPITLTLTVKDLIPLDALAVDDRMVTKWQTIGALRDSVDTDPNAGALKEILAKDAKYDDLSAGDKAVADDLLGQIGDISEQDRANVFEDIGFAFNL